LARTLANMTVPASGVRQQSVWASVVSDDAQALRGWLLALGFTEDLLIPGDDRDTIHHCQLDWPEGGRVLLSSTGERPTPCRPGTSSLHVVTATPDAVMARARALEVRVVHELVDQTDYLRGLGHQVRLLRIECQRRPIAVDQIRAGCD